MLVLARYPSSKVVNEAIDRFVLRGGVATTLAPARQPENGGLGSQLGRLSGPT